MELDTCHLRKIKSCHFSTLHLNYSPWEIFPTSSFIIIIIFSGFDRYDRLVLLMYKLQWRSGRPPYSSVIPKPGRGPNRFLMSTKFHSKNQGRSISTNNYSARDSARMIGWEIMSQPIKSNIDYCLTESWGWSLSLFHMITYILKQHNITQ